jgi:hypothetical protein
MVSTVRAFSGSCCCVESNKQVARRKEKKGIGENRVWENLNAVESVVDKAAN